MYEVKNVPEKHTIYVRMCGAIGLDELRAWMLEYELATNSYRGKPHFVLADMRGFVVLGPEEAALFGQTIEYGRRRGVCRCAHLSDSSIVRLQARRLAREASGHDKIVFDVVSVEEAERVFEEERRALAVSRRALGRLTRAYRPKSNQYRRSSAELDVVGPQSSLTPSPPPRSSSATKAQTIGVR